MAQNTFNNRLISNLISDASSLDPGLILSVGATNLKNTVDPAMLGGVLKAYNSALTQTFYVSAALAALSIFGSAAIEWKSVKGKKLETITA